LVKKASKASRAYRLIKEALASGQFSPGERLSEAKVARTLGLSRVPVRESLLRLEAEGALRSRGPYVGRYVAYIEDQKPEDVLYRYEVREIIEGQAARLAAKHMSGRSVDQLRIYLRQLEQSLRSHTHGLRVKAGQNLHRYIVAHCGNPILLDIWDTHHPVPMSTHSVALEHQIMKSLRDPVRHEKRIRLVVEAIAAHKPAAAEQQMRLYIREITEAIRVTLEKRAREEMGFEE
jgi:DNA-binding GntR family transcriptional regulator